MLVAMDDYPGGCWVYDNELARLVDDGCPHVEEERRYECGECGGMWVSYWKEESVWMCECPDCGSVSEDEPFPMEVAWGFLL